MTPARSGGDGPLGTLTAEMLPPLGLTGPCNENGPGPSGNLSHLTLVITWGERRDLNPRHPGPQPGALPTELRPPSSPGRTAGPQQDARCPGGHRAAEDKYSRLRRPACDVLAAPAEPG